MRAPIDPSRKKAVAGTISPPTAIGETKTTPSGVKYETLKAGDGPELKPGQTALFHYTGTLADGKVFDTSHQKDKDEPRSFEIGADKVIAGWEEGVPGMKVGERRKLTIPPELGYGEQGNPPSIPPNATIVFEIELVKIVK
jgi:FKBP-type peptidyl-prolyl cis-trans isomerase